MRQNSEFLRGDWEAEEISLTGSDFWFVREQKFAYVDNWQWSLPSRTGKTAGLIQS
jgi:hypothetical protein